MQAQTQSSSAVEASTNTFKIGDTVSYVVAKTMARSVEFSVRKGTIKAIDGQVAIVESRYGRSIQPLNKLSREGEANALTKSLMGDRHNA
ncbi:hypothetical protein [Pseudomonas rhodesiae]|uniref:hypothetical protein n=1 Tax=Pseudomonas rhodesiae TaxID=76760 RepID=UPI000F47EE5E|nr:hypothetical protein [Pseudomonas rhodesiae]ROM60394.1 hypothetical protein BK650_02940 [Pseudomonas rhodesiae]ROM68084.1 hypothetical protein BK651_03100 [Pseudomonas rhodesiae]